MAAIVAGVVLGNIVGAVNAPSDVESDVNTALTGTLNFHPSSVGYTGGFITIPVAASVLATLVAGPASLIISQGSGTVSQAVTQ